MKKFLIFLQFFQFFENFIFLAVLHILAKTNNSKMMESLVTTELNINPINKNGETPLVKIIFIS